MLLNQTVSNPLRLIDRAIHKCTESTLDIVVDTLTKRMSVVALDNMWQFN